MNRKLRRIIIPATVVVAVFTAAFIVAAVLNDEPNPGAQVAEAAGRVDRQVDDTQAAFTDIKELIPEDQTFQSEAVPSGAADNEPSSQANAAPQSSGQTSAPASGGASISIDMSRGINPGSDGVPANESIEETDAADADGDR